ncbi:hypothetical protein PV325_006564 [Microctonus aethiopoides]|nr:hypothetical protein PV325_006564 [Microctonus aethiopoides]KAK0094056.1 hypothetical protein PV326_011927 [Microctonus aethiopoides]
MLDEEKNWITDKEGISTVASEKTELQLSCTKVFNSWDFSRRHCSVRNLVAIKGGEGFVAALGNSRCTIYSVSYRRFISLYYLCFTSILLALHVSYFCLKNL